MANFGFLQSFHIRLCCRIVFILLLIDQWRILYQVVVMLTITLDNTGVLTVAFLHSRIMAMVNMSYLTIRILRVPAGSQATE